MIDRACISLNNNCNLKCKYCHFMDKQCDYKSFDYESLKKVIDNIHTYCLSNDINLFKLGFVGSGEPLLKAKVLFEILNYIKDRKYKELIMYTITNGTLLTSQIIKQFYEYKDIIKLCISLDGYKEIHNYGRSEFDKVTEGINNYYNFFGKFPSINSTVSYQSYINKEKLIDFFTSNKMTDVTFSKLVGYNDKDLLISKEQYLEFMDYAKKNGIKSRQFRNEKCYDCTMYGKLCGVGRTNIFISIEGVYPCGRFFKIEKYRLGNYSDSLESIEKELVKLDPVEDGKCYFEEKVGVD